MEEIYLRLDEHCEKVVNNVSKKMGLDYEIRGEFVSVGSLFSMIEDLYATIGSLEEEKEDMEREIEENYRRITPYEEIGMSERDFY